MNAQVQSGQSSAATSVPRETAAPWSEDAERAVLAAMILSADAIPTVLASITPEMFYREGHRRIYRAMQALHHTGAVVDPLTISNELEAQGDLKAAGGKEYLGGLLDEIPTAANVLHHCRIIREKAERRQLLELGQQLTGAARDVTVTLDEVRDLASRRLLAAVEGGEAAGFQPVSSGIEKMLQRLQAIEDGTLPPGLLTGWPELDAKLSGGFQPGDLVLVVGVPSSGKTTWMVNVLWDVAMRGNGATALVSAEMRKETISRNITASMSDVPVSAIRAGEMDAVQRRRVTRAAIEAARVPFEIDDTDTPTIEDLIVRCTLLKAKRPNLVAVGVDFLQMIQRRERERGVSEELALERTAYDLKALAKRLGIVVIAAVQPNDKQVEEREDKRTQLRDIARSGGPRRACDVAMLVYRPGQYSHPGNAFELNIAKFREGSLGVVTLEWDGAHSRITSPRRREAQAAAERERTRQFELAASGQGNV